MQIDSALQYMKVVATVAAVAVVVAVVVVAAATDADHVDTYPVTVVAVMACHLLVKCEVVTQAVKEIQMAVAYRAVIVAVVEMIDISVNIVEVET